MRQNHLICSLLLTGLLAAVASPALADGWGKKPARRGPPVTRSGLYFGFDLGAAKVFGDTNIVLDRDPASDCLIPAGAEAQVRSDTGSGFAFGLRMGYNILGYGALEGSVTAHGNKKSAANSWEGTGHVGILARIYPAEFLTLFDDRSLKALRDRLWDVNVYAGYGPYGIGGYHVTNDEGRGWEGPNFQWGLGGEYYVARTVSLGLDLKFVKPTYDTFLCKWDPRRTVMLKSTESPLVVAPMVTITFHLLDPHH